MSKNIFEVISEFGSNFAIQNDLILMEGIIYYFMLSNDKNIYRGKLITYYINKIEKRFIFENVEIYNGNSFENYTKSLSTSFIDKIYYF